MVDGETLGWPFVGDFSTMVVVCLDFKRDTTRHWEDIFFVMVITGNSLVHPYEHNNLKAMLVPPAFKGELLICEVFL